MVDSVLVQDIVSLPASGSSGNGGFVPGQGFKQTLGMALSLDIGNSSSNEQQPWDGVMVGEEL